MIGSLKNKTLLRDIVLLVLFSSALGVIYNSFASKPLTLIREPETIVYVSDEELESHLQAIDSAGQVPDTAADSSPALSSKDSVKNELPSETVAEPAEESAMTDAESAPTHKQVAAPSSADTAAKTEKVETNMTSTESALTEPLGDEGGDSHIQDVTYEQVVRLLDKPRVRFVDARRAEEFENGKIGNAINIFAEDYEQHIPEFIEWPREDLIVVYCGGGQCELSHELAEIFFGFGFSKVYVYRGGYNEWKEKRVN